MVGVAVGAGVAGAGSSVCCDGTGAEGVDSAVVAPLDSAAVAALDSTAVAALDSAALAALDSAAVAALDSLDSVVNFSASSAPSRSPASESCAGVGSERRPVVSSDVDTPAAVEAAAGDGFAATVCASGGCWSVAAESSRAVSARWLALVVAFEEEGQGTTALGVDCANVVRATDG